MGEVSRLHLSTPSELKMSAAVAVEVVGHVFPVIHRVAIASYPNLTATQMVETLRRSEASLQDLSTVLEALTLHALRLPEHLSQWRRRFLQAQRSYHQARPSLRPPPRLCTRPLRRSGQERPGACHSIKISSLTRRCRVEALRLVAGEE